MTIRYLSASATALAFIIAASTPALARGASEKSDVGHYAWQLAPHTGTKEVARGGRYVWIGPKTMALAQAHPCKGASLSRNAQAADCMTVTAATPVAPVPPTPGDG